jgi:hypothetical protein
VSRRGLRTTLGIALPICLLVLAALTDRIVHHAPVQVQPPAPQRPAEAQAQATPQPTPSPEESELRTIADLMERIQMRCSEPDAVEDCTPSRLAASFAQEMPLVRKHRERLETRWIALLSTWNPIAAYGLALLDSHRALPALRARLLRERRFYGWETSSPDDPKILFSDDQFPSHRAVIAAIEWIDGRPIRQAVKLTRAERRELREDAADCDGAAAARWLLHKLEGAPLPSRAANRAQRLRCADSFFPFARSDDVIID